MSVFSFFRGAETDPEMKRAVELGAYLDRMDGTLSSDYNKRINGDGIYSGYNTLRDFYKGKQWSYRKGDGGTMRTYNYVFTIVENMTAFLTNEPPQVSCPPLDSSNVLDRAMAEGRTKILNAIHDDNKLSLVFQRSARTASLNGDAYIFGPIPTFKVNAEGAEEFDRIRYWNVEKPETIRPIWKDDNYNELDAFVKEYRVNFETAKKMFALEAKKYGFIITPDNNQTIFRTTEQTDQPMTTFQEYWSEDEYVLRLKESKKSLIYIKHDWGFLPLQYIPNIHIPGEPRGTSDIEHELDPQQEYNERTSDLADIIKQVAQPTYWGKNLDSVSEIRAGGSVIYQVGDDAEINAMPASGQSAPMERYLSDRKDDIVALSGMNSVLYPNSNVMQATGRALSVIMQGVNNKVSLRKEWWSQAFQSINAHILFLTEKHVPKAKVLINGNYQSDVFISSVLVRNVSDEINKFQAKLQSLTTTQHNIGVPNPSEEQKLMKEELQDEILATEISRQPGLLHSILAQRIADMNQATTGAITAAGLGGINGAPPNIATEGDNQPGMMPAPIQGQASPVSPQGAAALQASRGGAPAQVQSR